jgi:hypothetical protein
MDAPKGNIPDPNTGSQYPGCSAGDNVESDAVSEDDLTAIGEFLRAHPTERYLDFDDPEEDEPLPWWARPLKDRDWDQIDENRRRWSEDDE